MFRKSLYFLIICTLGCRSVYEQPGAYKAHLDTPETALAAINAELQWNKEDKILLYQEQGYVYNQLQEFKKSNQSFSHATELRQKYEEMPTVSLHLLADIGLASFSNLGVISYKGSPVEDIEARAYKALNYLFLGNHAAARVEAFAAYSAQQAAATYYQKEIEQRVQAAKSQGIDVNKILKTKEMQEDIQHLYKDRPELAQYKDFVNPFSVMVNTIVFLAARLEPQDIDRASKNLHRLKDMKIDAHILKPLSTYAEQIRKNNIEPLVIVLFENGKAPGLGESSLVIPLPLKGFTMLTIAFPKLLYEEYDKYNLRWENGKTRRLCSFEDIRTSEFKIKLPGVMAKTIAISVVKAGLQYEISRLTENNELAIFLTSLYNVNTNRADTRIWKSLPAEYRMGVSSRPASGILTLQARESAHTIKLPAGECVLVYVRDKGHKKIDINVSVLK